MPLLTQPQVQELLQSYVETLAECVLRAWQNWKALEQSAARPLSTRSRASCVYDFICAEVRRQFDGDSNVSYDTRYGMLTVNFMGQLIARFKKVDDDLRASNIQTRRQQRMSLQLELPDMPPEALRVIVGYRLDMLQVSISDIHIIRPDGEKVGWHYPIYTAVPQSLPFPDVVETDTTPIVRAKNPRRKARQENE